jgi:tRNA pseudouridine38-40 synthase
LRYFIYISYKGTSYHGWQLQPNSVTVQKILDNALSVILSEEISTIGAGRTDTGVHALVFCAHFESSLLALEINKNFIQRLNRYLPKDIAVSSVKKVKSDASARFSAISRTYKYFISKTKDPFFDDSSWYLQRDLDIEKMNLAANILLKHSDFTSFSKLHSDVKTNICKIYSAEWESNENRIIFTIRADRFLRNMVRAIVGTMIDIGSGKTNLQEFEFIINSKDRCKAGRSVPAKGLFLTEIRYPEDIFI